MKRWDSAPVSSHCSYDYAHRIKAGDRVGVVEAGSIRKVYCGDCARSRHGFVEDTGETLDVTDAPNFPKPLKDLAGAAHSSLFAEAFEEEKGKVLPFDGRAAAAGEDRD